MDMSLVIPLFALSGLAIAATCVVAAKASAVRRTVYVTSASKAQSHSGPQRQ